jgi:uncharacterized protein YndB with AHSA1/START domain
LVAHRIEREIVIDAPVDVVWEVVTRPEHVSGWFSDATELDLSPGGGAVFRWNDYGAVHGRVERVEPPHFLSFRWVVRPSEEVADGNSTLVEFSLRAEGDSTRLTVVESGFRDLAGPDEDKQGHVDSHRRGWELELGELEDYVRERA